MMPIATPLYLPVASVSSEKASALLAGNVKMKLQYVLEDEKKPAVLRYLPVYTGNYIVRADTGALVNLDELQNLYSTAYASARGMGGAEKSADSNGLSEVELSAVSDLEGVLSKEKLDEALRSIKTAIRCAPSTIGRIVKAMFFAGLPIRKS